MLKELQTDLVLWVTASCSSKYGRHRQVYTEMEFIPEVVFQSKFSRFYFPRQGLVRLRTPFCIQGYIFQYLNTA